MPKRRSLGVGTDTTGPRYHGWCKKHSFVAMLTAIRIKIENTALGMVIRHDTTVMMKEMIGTATNAHATIAKHRKNERAGNDESGNDVTTMAAMTMIA